MLLSGAPIHDVVLELKACELVNSCHRRSRAVSHYSTRLKNRVVTNPDSVAIGAVEDPGQEPSVEGIIELAVHQVVFENNVVGFSRQQFVVIKQGIETRAETRCEVVDHL